MADFKFSVSNELKAEGVKVKAAIFSALQVVNRVTALENEKKDFIGDLRNQKSPILDEYENLHVKHGQPNFPPPAEALISLIMEKGRFPNINCVVDSYNLVSAQSFLSIGAHDLDKIKGSLSLKIASGNELYIPLGSQARQKINQENMSAWMRKR